VGPIKSYYAGHDDWPGPANLNYGTQASIVTNYADLCSSAGSKSFSYVGLDQAILGGGYIYVGYVIDGGVSQTLTANLTDTPLYFSKVFSPGYTHSYRLALTGPAIGSTHLYTVQYIASAHHSIFGYDYTEMAHTNFDLNSDWSGGRHNLYRSEVTASGSDVTGSSGSPTRFSNLAVQQPFHNCCQTTPPTLYYSGPTTSRFHTGAVASNRFDTYTIY
jgi:hypothetical protein